MLRTLTVAGVHIVAWWTVIHASGRKRATVEPPFHSLVESAETKNATIVPFSHLSVVNSMSWLDSIDDTPLQRTRSNPRDPTYNMSLDELHEECRLVQPLSTVERDASCCDCVTSGN